MTYLVTGAAGFIGNALALDLLSQGYEVVGIDNLNDYYDVQLKQDRLARLDGFPKFHFIKMGIEDREAMRKLSFAHQFKRIYHMAAQAGVRYSIENPNAYIDSNLVGFGNILELARSQHVDHLIFASSSSVYGESDEQPFREDQRVDNPVSLYAATKKANEVMAHSYSYLYGIPTTGLRFFTVYGPWGRPDMAPFLFTDAILNERPIDVFNHGNMKRDFTYIDDIVTGIVKVGQSMPESKTTTNSNPPYQILNIGNSKPVRLGDFISFIERFSGKEADKNMMDIQPGDVTSTHADVSKLAQLTNYAPQTELEEGVRTTVEWFKEYYKRS